MSWALAIAVFMAPPPLPLGGSSGFDAHIRDLEAQFNAHPEHTTVLQLIQAYGRLGQPEKIREWARQARDLKVQAGQVELVSGRAYLMAGQYEAAIITLFGVCRQHPENGPAHTGLWRAVIDAEVIPSTVDLEAVRTLLIKRGYFLPANRPAHASRAKASTLSQAGFEALHQGDPEVAVEQFQKALSVHRRFPEAYRGLGAAHARSNRPAKALAAYRLYLVLTEGNSRLIRRVRRKVTDAERHRGLERSSRNR